MRKASAFFIISFLFFSCNQDKPTDRMETSIRKYFNESVKNNGLQIYKFRINNYSPTNEFAADSIRLTSLKWAHESLFYSTNDLDDQTRKKMEVIDMEKRNGNNDLSVLQADYDKCYSSYILTKDSLEDNEREDSAIKAKINSTKNTGNSYYKVAVSLRAKKTNAEPGDEDYRAEYNYILDKNLKVIAEERTYLN